MECSRGLEGNNYLTVVRKERADLSLQDAVILTGENFQKTLEELKETRTKLRFEDEQLNEDVEKYIFSVEQWAIGSLIWSFASPRYFGVEHDQIKESLVVNLPDRGLGDEDRE